MSSNQNGSIWPIVVAIFVVVAILQTIFGDASSSSSTSSYTPPSSDNSFERRYVEQRFKQEGYSNKEASQAADAILRFQQAQEARRNR